jgi:twinkle protein
MAWFGIAIIAAIMAANILKGITMIGPCGMEFLEGRGISVELAVRYGLRTVSLQGEGDEERWVTSENGRVIGYPFIDHGEVVNEKYRPTDAKKFWHMDGGKSTFWNADILQSGHAALIIVEGIEDALVSIQCGFPFTVSVPNGAPNPGSRSEISEDATNRFAFFHANIRRLKEIKRFILATDNDTNGRFLASELVRRLGAARCSFVELPENIKDINELLLTQGSEAVARVLNTPKPYPVRGLYKLRDYPPRQELETFSTGWATVDQHALMFPGEFMVITGIPSHGKSAWSLNLLANLCELHDWRAAIFSPEMGAVPIIRNILRKIKLRGVVGHDCDAWIDHNFSFIDADPTGLADDDQPFDLEFILECARDAVLRDGIRVLLIDPWNEIEHARKPGESITDYVAVSNRIAPTSKSQIGEFILFA